MRLPFRAISGKLQVARVTDTLKASSLGRGPRCAAWMQDYVNDVGGDLEAQVMVGGIRGWVQRYGGSLMDGYDEKVWLGVDVR